MSKSSVIVVVTIVIVSPQASSLLTEFDVWKTTSSSIDQSPPGSPPQAHNNDTSTGDVCGQCDVKASSPLTSSKKTQRPAVVFAPPSLEIVKTWEVEQVWEKAYPCLYPFGRGGPDPSKSSKMRVLRPKRLTDAQYDMHVMKERSGRFAGCPAYYFARYKYRMSQRASGIACAAMKQGDAKMTMGDLRNVADYTEHELDNMLPRNAELDAILKRLKGFSDKMRSSYVHIAVERSRLLARLASPLMPNPTWFMTLSSADLHWPELWQSIDSGLSADEASRLPYKTRCELLNNNPALAARLFKERLHAILEEIIIGGLYHPLGGIVDYWFRIEFQNRGSLHAHSILWAMLMHGGMTVKELGQWFNGDQLGSMMKDFMANEKAKDDEAAAEDLSSHATRPDSSSLSVFALTSAAPTKKAKRQPKKAKRKLY